MTRTVFIINPVAGTTDPDELERDLEAATTNLGHAYESRRTTGEGDAARWAGELAREGVQRLVAVGGDGTLREVVSGVLDAEQDVPVAFIPAGSANVMADVLNIPNALEDAVEIALEATGVAFDVGEVVGVEGGYFLVAAAAGLPAEIITESSRPLKRVAGIGAYGIMALRFLPDLFRPQKNAVLEIDGHKLKTDAHSVLVINAGRVPGANIEFVPGASPYDGLLDVLIVEERTPWTLVRRLVDFVRGERRSGLNIKQGKEVRLSQGGGFSFQIDGDPLEVNNPRMAIHSRPALLVQPAGAR